MNTRKCLEFYLVTFCTFNPHKSALILHFAAKKLFCAPKCILFSDKPHSIQQAAPGRMVANWLHQNQTLISAGTNAGRLHCCCQGLFGPITCGPLLQGSASTGRSRTTGTHCSLPLSQRIFYQHDRMTTGSVSMLNYINSWVIIWSSDYPDCGETTLFRFIFNFLF